MAFSPWFRRLWRNKEKKLTSKRFIGLVHVHKEFFLHATKIQHESNSPKGIRKSAHSIECYRNRWALIKAVNSFSPGIAKSWHCVCVRVARWPTAKQNLCHSFPFGICGFRESFRMKSDDLERSFYIYLQFGTNTESSHRTTYRNTV